MDDSPTDQQLQWLEWKPDRVDTVRESHTSAMNAVLDTPELLESIFAQLPARRLVVATGVCRAIRKMVLESPALRKKLFLQRTDSEPQHCRLSFDDPGITFDGGGVKWWTGYMFMDKPEYHDDPEIQALHRFQVVRACPLVSESNEPGRDHITPLPERVIKMSKQRQPDYTLWREKARAAGPWLQMYLTMPPCETVDLKHSWAGRDEGGKGNYCTVDITRTIKREGGVKCAVINDMMDLPGSVEVAHGLNDAEVVENTTARAQLDILKARGFKMRVRGFRMINLPAGFICARNVEIAAMERDLAVVKKEAAKWYEKQLAEREEYEEDAEREFQEGLRKKAEEEAAWEDVSDSEEEASD